MLRGGVEKLCVFAKNNHINKIQSLIQSANEIFQPSFLLVMVGYKMVNEEKAL